MPLYFLFEVAMTPEAKFQASLIKKIKSLLPGCYILKNDPNYIQGIPDLLILYNTRWAMLECKESSTASHRPNQEFYVNRMNEMSYASFVFPENEQEVLDELQRALESPR